MSGRRGVRRSRGSDVGAARQQDNEVSVCGEISSSGVEERAIRNALKPSSGESGINNSNQVQVGKPGDDPPGRRSRKRNRNRRKKDGEASKADSKTDNDAKLLTTVVKSKAKRKRKRGGTHIGGAKVDELIRGQTSSSTSGKSEGLSSVSSSTGTTPRNEVSEFSEELIKGQTSSSTSEKSEGLQSVSSSSSSSPRNIGEFNADLIKNQTSSSTSQHSSPASSPRTGEAGEDLEKTSELRSKHDVYPPFTMDGVGNTGIDSNMQSIWLTDQQATEKLSGLFYKTADTTSEDRTYKIKITDNGRTETEEVISNQDEGTPIHYELDAHTLEHISSTNKTPSHEFITYTSENEQNESEDGISNIENKSVTIESSDVDKLHQIDSQKSHTNLVDFTLSKEQKLLEESYTNNLSGAVFSDSDLEKEVVLEVTTDDTNSNEIQYIQTDGEEHLNTSNHYLSSGKNEIVMPIMLAEVNFCDIADTEINLHSNISMDDVGGNEMKSGDILKGIDENCLKQDSLVNVSKNHSPEFNSSISLQKEDKAVAEKLVTAENSFNKNSLEFNSSISLQIEDNSVEEKLDLTENNSKKDLRESSSLISLETEDKSLEEKLDLSENGLNRDSIEFKSSTLLLDGDKLLKLKQDSSECVSKKHSLEFDCSSSLQNEEESQRETVCVNRSEDTCERDQANKCNLSDKFEIFTEPVVETGCVKVSEDCQKEKTKLRRPVGKPFDQKSVSDLSSPSLRQINSVSQELIDEYEDDTSENLLCRKSEDGSVDSIDAINVGINYNIAQTVQEDETCLSKNQVDLQFNYTFVEQNMVEKSLKLKEETPYSSSMYLCVNKERDEKCQSGSENSETLTSEVEEKSLDIGDEGKGENKSEESTSFEEPCPRIVVEVVDNPRRGEVLQSGDFASESSDEEHQKEESTNESIDKVVAATIDDKVVEPGGGDGEIPLVNASSCGLNRVTGNTALVSRPSDTEEVVLQFNNPTQPPKSPNNCGSGESEEEEEMEVIFMNSFEDEESIEGDIMKDKPKHTESYPVLKKRKKVIKDRQVAETISRVFWTNVGLVKEPVQSGIFSLAEPPPELRPTMTLMTNAQLSSYLTAAPPNMAALKAADTAPGDGNFNQDVNNTSKTNSKVKKKNIFRRIVTPLARVFKKKKRIH